MKELQDLTYWTVSRLQELPSERLLEFTREAFHGLTRARLLLGRCLLALKHTEACQLHGYSGVLHFCNWSGVDVREAAEARRVARRLEELPGLRAAAESGGIAWSQLREVVRKASPETEARWLELAGRCSYKEIERLVARTGDGENPLDPDALTSHQPEMTELRVLLPASVDAMLQLVVRSLSHQEARLVPMAEVLEFLAAEHLAGGEPPSRRAREKVLEQARRDVAAARERESREWSQRLAPKPDHPHASPNYPYGTCPEQAPDFSPNDPHGLRADQHGSCPEHNGQHGSEIAGPDGSHSDGPPGLEPSPDFMPGDPHGSSPPWVALAADPSVCPHQPGLQLLTPAPPHWPNPRLAFNADRRGLTPAQRREILRRDGYRCATPGCPNHLWLDVHHIVFYCLGGVTIPENLVVCCRSCHRNLHRGFLRVSGTAPGRLVWTDRHGLNLRRE